jgi:hypothetical protein
MVLHRQQCCSHRELGGVQQQALDTAFIFIQLVYQRLWIRSLLLRDLEVHDVLGGVLEVAKLLLQTCISSCQMVKSGQPTGVLIPVV